MDGIIFDVDGTLWDTTRICAKSWQRAVKEKFGIELSLTGEMLEGLFGKPMDVIFKGIFPDFSDEKISNISKACCEYEEAEIDKSDICPYDGVKEIFENLGKKYPLFIVSNCQKGYIELFLRKCKLEKYIKDFCCYGDTLDKKSVTMKMLIERNSLKAPVYVGDTLGDEIACREADVKFIYAAYGFGEAQTPYCKIESISELQNVIE